MIAPSWGRVLARWGRPAAWHRNASAGLRFRGPMRIMFIGCLAVLLGGLAYFTTIGLLHR